MQVRLDELDAIDTVSVGRRSPEEERRAREIGGDDDAIRSREIQRHLTGSAPDLHDSRISGNCAIEQLREAAAFGARAERVEIVAQALEGYLTFRRCGIDVLVAGSTVVTKRTAVTSAKESGAWSSNSVVASTVA